MEFVEGESLAGRLRRTGRASIDEALSVTLQIVDALAAAWAKGVVHRDVKPSNILLDGSGQAHVADFGLAKPVATEDPGLTSTGSIVGTPHYISPEQARGEPVDFRSDIYSLGIVLYEMLTGERPFKGTTPASIVAQHLHQPFPSLRQAREDVPTPLVELVEKMAQKDPNRRPGSYSELRETVERITPKHATAQAPSPPRLSKAVWLGIGAAVAGVAILSGLLLTMNRRAMDSLETRPIQIEKLTNRGTVWGDPVLSPDGRYVAYLSKESGEYFIWLKDVSEGTEVRLVGPFETESSPALKFFSSESRYVYYTQRLVATSVYQLFRISVIGGQSRLIAQTGWSGAQLSPNGTHILYRAAGKLLISNADGSAAKEIAVGDIEDAAWAGSNKVLLRRAGSLIILDIDRGEERKIPYLPPDPELTWVEATWRPGSTTAVILFRTRDGASVLYAVDLENGSMLALGGSWDHVDSLQWLPDGSAFIVAGVSEEKTGRYEKNPDQVWIVSCPDGVRRAIGEGGDVAVAMDGKRILATQTVEASDVVVLKGGDPRFIKRILSGTDVSYSLCWTLGGELIISSNEAGTYDLYVVNPERALGGS